MVPSVYGFIHNATTLLKLGTLESQRVEENRKLNNIQYR